MGNVYRQTYTKPLPDGAELITRKGEPIAKWRDRRGKRRTAPVVTGNGRGDRITLEAATYTAKYRDGSGHVVKTATGCRTLDAARAVLVELETRADKVRSGKWTAAEDSVLDHQCTPIDAHVVAYLGYLRTKRGKGGKPRVSPKHVGNVERNLNRIVADCSFKWLRDLKRAAAERWADQREADGMAARTINTHLAALTAFGNWCVESGRIVANPLARPPKRDERADRRRTRRALTYKALVLTGLRKSELDGLTVGHLELDGSVAFAVLDASGDKAGRGADIPLRSDLAADLRAWLADRLEAVRTETRAAGAPIPARLPADTPLLNVPTGLVRILDRDLKVAGIPKTDDRGRTVDVHAMRHTFGTHLSKGGVAPRTAQAAMRHGNIHLTMNCYTDPKLLDVAGAMNVLPELPMDPTREADRQRATGTDGSTEPAARKFAPLFARTDENPCNPLTIPDRTDDGSAASGSVLSGTAVKSYECLSSHDTLRALGLEPKTYGLKGRCSTD